jgi:antitoxin component YwqK of YwqJK toxin-antitoxin module
MAMAFMARQALFLSSIFLLIVACQQGTKTNTPLEKVEANAAAFSLNQGILLYENKPFSGIQYLLFANQDTAKVSTYIVGKEQGWSKIWYEDGRLAEERYYEKGKRENIHRAWWPDGKLRFEYHFKNDEHHGQQKDWFLNGKLAEVFNYENGHEEGQQQMWFDDGSLKANYVIKEGRRFGLPGVKNCISVVENNIFRTKK